MKRRSILAGALVAVVVLAGIGGFWIRKCALDRADGEALASMQGFFQLVGDGHPPATQFEAIRSELVRMQELSTRCRPDLRQALLLRRMDGAFVIGDFAAAEKLMDEYAERSELWRAGAKAKIRAHAAMIAGDNRKAVAELETFVKMAVADPELKAEVDPTTGQAWTREMIVAKNYFRMAELSSAYDVKASAVYAAKAREYLDAARRIAAGDGEMLKTIESIAAKGGRP